MEKTENKGVEVRTRKKVEIKRKFCPATMKQWSFAFGISLQNSRPMLILVCTVFHAQLD